LLSAVAVIPLAKFIGQATEELAAKMGAAWGGLLNVTFGNATELIIGIFALRAGLLEVVKASITGSIIGNILLVLGTAMIAGGTRFKKQEFNRTAALASGSTLFLAVVALTIPTLLPVTAPYVSASAVEWLSVLTALFMMLMYAATLLFSLHTHKHLYVPAVAAEAEVAIAQTEGTWSVKKGIIVLLVSTLAVSWVSEILVAKIDPVAASFGWTKLFIGVVVLAIIGNVAEHASAVTMAVKNKMDLTLQISIGSATQIVMFVAPVFVFASIWLKAKMNLVFNPFELASILLSVIIVNLVLEDGESNWLEGVQLLIAYFIIAIAFFVHP
jgi:Ca2+:H+ antiporter